MAEQVQQDKTLHLEADVRIDQDLQPVERAGSRWFQVAVRDGKAVLHNLRRRALPEFIELVCRQVADTLLAWFANGDQFTDGDVHLSIFLNRSTGDNRRAS